MAVALVVPAAAYVAGSLAPRDDAPPADHSPVILRDAEPTTDPATDPGGAATSGPSAPPAGGDRDEDRDDRDDRDDRGEREGTRVVVPQPTPVGEDDDWDDDGPGEDDTDDDGDDRDDRDD